MMKARFLLLVACTAHQPSNTDNNNEQMAGEMQMQATGASGGFSTHQAAALVLGQNDFTSNTKPSSIAAGTVDASAGSAAFDGTHLFLPDTYAHRVLSFDAMPTANGAVANSAFGQASLTESVPGASAERWYLPQALHADGSTLAVAESGGNRVLLISNGTTVTLGSAGCAADKLQSPASAFIANGRLLVADRSNHRVLVWNMVPSASNTPADLVLGQGSLTSCAANDSLRNGTSALRSAKTLREPTDVWTDGTRIAVADRGNNRILVWTTFPTSNGTPADAVMGQKDFAVARDDVLSRPSALAVKNGRLFVADAGHNRVLSWAQLASGDADLVLGQPDLKHFAGASPPTAQSFAFPTGVAFAGNDLVVTDTLNYRFLVFRPH